MATGDEPRMVRRITIDGPVSVGIDGRHGRRRNGDTQIAAAALKSGSANDRLCEGFRTPAATNVSTRTTAGVRKPSRDETAGRARIGRCRAFSYGGLAVWGPQLRFGSEVG